MHQYYKKKDQGTWLTKIINKMMKPFSPVGTIGPIMYLEGKKGLSRSERRKEASIWRRFGAAAVRIATYREWDLEDPKLRQKALDMAMAGK